MPPEVFAASPDVETHAGQILDVDVGARARLRQGDLLQVLGELRPGSRVCRELIRAGFDVACPGEYRCRTVDGGDALALFEALGQQVDGTQEIRVQRVAGRCLHP